MRDEEETYTTEHISEVHAMNSRRRFILHLSSFILLFAALLIAAVAATTVNPVKTPAPTRWAPLVVFANCDRNACAWLVGQPADTDANARRINLHACSVIIVCRAIIAPRRAGFYGTGRNAISPAGVVQARRVRADARRGGSRPRLEGHAAGRRDHHPDAHIEAAGRESGSRVVREPSGRTPHDEAPDYITK